MTDDLRTVGIADRDALVDAIAREGLALSELLHVSGPGRAGVPVPGLDWNVAETSNTMSRGAPAHCSGDLGLLQGVHGRPGVSTRWQRGNGVRVPGVPAPP